MELHPANIERKKSSVCDEGKQRIIALFFPE
jgi:hypothetical protein